jgi:hypothetical protein
MNTNRRDFLRALLAAGALGSLGRESQAQPKPGGPKRGPNAPAQIRQIALGLLLDPDTPAGRGMRLGLEEAQHAGQLLHRNFVAAPTSEFALIGIDPPKVETRALFLQAAPSQVSPAPAWNVTSSPAFREQALARHLDRKDLRVTDWHSGLMKFGAEELNVRFRRRFHQEMDERAWHGWIAVKCAVEIALRYPGGDPKEKIAVLRLDGHKGMMLRFDLQDRHLVQPVYLVDAKGKMVEAVEPEWKE